ncbi:MAG: metal ABC transporter permease [Planctomycetaceae bacterium]|jgi:zinc transport system permease protein|nr:metal ABC transporter permease [Planctomycetaceae bacterium]
MNHLKEIFFAPEFAFLRQAFLVSAAASFPFGIIGTFVVVRRIGYLASAISHCAFGGIGLGIFFQQLAAAAGFSTLAFFLNPFPAAVVFSILSAVLIGVVRYSAKEREDAVIGSIWASGMAVGILFLDKTPGYHSVEAYLFGEILLTSNTGLLIVGVLSLGILLVTGLFFKRFEAICFDEEYVTLRGLPAKFYFQFLLVLVALIVVLMIQLVGVILVIALLTLPASIAGRLTFRLFPMAVLATGLCFVLSWTGLILSSRFDTAASPTIILVSAAAYVLVLLTQFLYARIR